MNILIVEDEPVIAQRIERLTTDILGSRISHIKKSRSLEEAKSYLMVHQIDLLFLDLNLKEKDGFRLLEEEQAGSFYTIIISACTDRAIRAFDYPVLDFIEKPFGKDCLIKAFQKLENFDAKNNFTSKFLSFKKNGEIKLIEIDKITYIKGAGVYSEVTMLDDSKELHHLNLKKLNLRLPASFIRIHKSYIVNIYAVHKIISHGGSRYSLLLNNETSLPVSRKRYPEIKNMLTGT